MYRENLKSPLRKNKQIGRERNDALKVERKCQKTTGQ